MKIIIAIFLTVLLGAGCTDAAASFQGARDRIAEATTAIQQKIADIASAIDAAREQWEKAQAIVNILQSDSDDASADPASSDSVTEGSAESTTPSVPPSEDPLPPATEDNISSP